MASWHFFCALSNWQPLQQGLFRSLGKHQHERKKYWTTFLFFFFFPKKYEHDKARGRGCLAKKLLQDSLTSRKISASHHDHPLPTLHLLKKMNWMHTKHCETTRGLLFETLKSSLSSSTCCATWDRILQSSPQISPSLPVLKLCYRILCSLYPSPNVGVPSAQPHALKLREFLTTQWVQWDLSPAAGCRAEPFSPHAPEAAAPFPSPALGAVLQLAVRGAAGISLLVQEAGIALLPLVHPGVPADFVVALLEALLGLDLNGPMDGFFAAAWEHLESHEGKEQHWGVNLAVNKCISDSPGLLRPPNSGVSGSNDPSTLTFWELGTILR